MKSKSGGAQLRLIGDETTQDASPNAALIGRCFSDGLSDVRVIDICRSNPSQVLVEREQDGKSWTVSASLIRLIVGRERRKRTA